jgi:hypothetical protein
MTAAVESRGWSTVVCAATGPSFNPNQAAAIEAARARGVCHVVAINDNYRLLPRADVLYACDGKWWDVHNPNVRRAFHGEMWTQDVKAAARYGLRHVDSANQPGLCRDPFRIHTGGNSGYQAVNLAFHFGARTIVLVGYDMQGQADKPHWFGEHPSPLSRTRNYLSWRERFAVMATDLHLAGVRVINCTTHTALACFPMGSLAEVLA